MNKHLLEIGTLLFLLMTSCVSPPKANQSEVNLIEEPLPDLRLITKIDSMSDFSNDYFVVVSNCERAQILAIDTGNTFHVSIRETDFGGRINTNFQHYDDYLLYLHSKEYMAEVPRLDTGKVIELIRWIDNFKLNPNNRKEDREFFMGSCTESTVYFKELKEEAKVKKIFPIGINKGVHTKNLLVNSILQR